jgi:hypothetical protein
LVCRHAADVKSFFGKENEMELVRVSLFVLATVAVTLMGCGPGESGDTAEPAEVDGSGYLLAAEPGGAQDVIAVLQDAQDGDDVVVVGRIGGRSDPWEEGLAAFNIADLSMTPCNERDDDECPVPWDYCCEPDVATSHTLVKVVDPEGNTVPHGAQQLLKVKELQTVVVQGKARRDESGNLSLLATGVYVRP